ncbi:DNA-binding transcriptional activator of the SARP family [Streptosporangium subroseum]|uniref:DNA-binding transcriptional activator of the SARP family n=1 Tax=Streptosporangium subroseum TaxID=106412 RepID=A0A239IRP6_9ACTN|nr:BTAD domain-containing putative transcriptional regulator [Streptosporangium subroseum]SNS96237.1 DNA-binding transcriptional activator of the SARP family [Streptosporangium subroseum]
MTPTESMRESVRFAVLGPVLGWRADAELDLGPPRQRALLAVLLARGGRPTGLAEIIDVLWGEDPPDSAVNVVQRHVGELRRLFEPGLPRRAVGQWLVRSSGGYRLNVDPDTLDLLRFRHLVEEARRTAQDVPQAAGLLIDALELWRGSAAEGIAAGVRAHPVFIALDHEYLAVLKEAADTALRDGPVTRLVPMLQQAAELNPFDEPLHTRLVLALAATGHRAEALDTYRAAYSRLVEKLGIGPGPELRSAHEQVLQQTAPEESPPARVTVGAIRPAQLPGDLPAFAGRREELAQVLDLLPDGEHPTAAVVISAIGGMAGIGKTTLAVHWAHRIAHRFPDGQLYVNLRGFDADGAVLDPAEAIRGFLDALGVSPRDIPARLDDQAALYRSLLADRRVLVLLDNAHDTKQVRPLLPGAPGCLAIVTSRNRLSGLVAAEGARSLTLGLLSDAEAHEFLTLRLDAERVAAEPLAVQEITTLCARLPLALSIAAARAVTQPDFSLAAIAAELRAAHGSLDAFTGADGIDVGAVFSWSYRALTSPAARLFRLLALHPGPYFSASAAAALGALPAHRVRPLLAELTRAYLLTEYAPGRYTFHDLLRAYAAERSRVQDTDSFRRVALHRLIDHYLQTACRAALLFSPHRDAIFLQVPVPGAFPEILADREQASDWLTAEHAVLLAIIDLAADARFSNQAWQLAWALEHFLDRRGHWHDLAASQRTALKAARRLPDRTGMAHAHRGLARAEADLGRYEEAQLHLGRALALFGEVGDGTAQAHTHRQFSWVLEQQAKYDGALTHAQQALDLFRAGGRRAGQAASLNAVGWYHALLGRHEQALIHCREALSLLAELGDRYGQADTWDSLGYAHHHLGRYEQATVSYRRALELYRQLGVRYGEADTLTRLSSTHLAAGRHEEARTALETALASLDDLGHPDAERVRTSLRTLGDSPNGAVSSS